jgi:hypothetical protein
MVPILRRTNPVCIFTAYFFKINFNNIQHLHLDNLISYLEIFPLKFYKFLACVLHAPPFLPSIFFSVFIFDKKHKLWSFSLGNFLLPLLLPTLLDPSLLLSALIINNYKLRVWSFLGVRDQVSHPYRSAGRLIYFSVKRTGTTSPRLLSYAKWGKKKNRIWKIMCIKIGSFLLTSIITHIPVILEYVL